MFIIYVNDLSLHLTNCFIVQYADDTQILIEGSINDLENLIERAEDILMRAKIYFQKNGLLLNESKTQCIFIGSRQFISQIGDEVSINFNGNILKPSKEVKNLGVYFDRYMTFESHIDRIYKKVMGTLIYLNRVKDFFEPATRVIVVQSLALSLINYCLKVWGSTQAVHLNKAQKVQNFAVRVAIGNVRKYDHVSPFYKDLEWLRVKDKYFYDVCILTFKILRNFLPDWLYTFETVHSVSNISTRQRDNLIVRRTYTNIGARDFNIRGAIFWNTLPQEVREINSLSNFKAKLRNYLLNGRSLTA